MAINIFIVLFCAFIPILFGFLWYSPLMFGRPWQRAAKAENVGIPAGTMGMRLALTYLFSIFLSLVLVSIVNHYSGIISLFVTESGWGEAGTEAQLLYDTIIERLGHKHRSFGHGMLHGSITGMTVAFPIISILALFELRSWKYIAINAGFWVLSMTIMGGIICQWWQPMG
ncbi:MAG: DUF1761 domain-containing protein [Saprospiraceae bacterium]|nr:DUF1761 domain-containing protein [Saprospiraceae bacterium]